MYMILFFLLSYIMHVSISSSFSHLGITDVWHFPHERDKRVPKSLDSNSTALQIASCLIWLLQKK